MEEINSTPTSDAVNLENDRELKAHIYQQLVDLQPYLSPEAQIAVLLHQEDEEWGSEDEREHTLTLVATLGEFRLESEGRNADIYEAFAIAKRKMVEQLDEWHSNVVDSSERDAQIQSVIEGRHMIH